jgi:WD40 repeat protein
MPRAITAVAAHGTSLVLADTAGGLEHLTASGGSQTIRQLEINAVGYSPGGTLITGSRDGTIRIERSPTQPPQVIHASGPIVAISAADHRFLTRTANGSVRIYALDGRLLRALRARVQQATFATDGAVVATTTAREADLWDATTGELLHRLEGHTSLVTDVEFSRDGSTVVTASDDHDARTWDVASGRLLHVLRGHFFPVRAASFSPDGRWVVTASQFTAGLWDALSGQLVLYLQGNTRPLTGAVFSPDGNWILTGSDDGTARIVRCDICSNLSGLEKVARQRLRNIGSVDQGRPANGP